jgi:hypothetical protein
MFTIDLLKGSARPPGNRPLQVAVVTIAFSVLAVVAVLDAVRYFACGREISAEQRALAHYQREITALADVAGALQAAEQHRQEVNATLAEVSAVLAHHTKWTSVLVALSESAPKGITINDLMAKREEQKDAQQNVKYNYSLMMGVVSPSGPTAVEQFVRALRLALPLVPDSAAVRIVSQRQTQIQGRDFQYYVIECHLKP